MHNEMLAGTVDEIETTLQGLIVLATIVQDRFDRDRRISIYERHIYAARKCKARVNYEKKYFTIQIRRWYRKREVITTYKNYHDNVIV